MQRIYVAGASKSYELWKQQKQLKTIGMNEAQNVYDEGYIYQFSQNSTHRNKMQPQKHWIQRYHPMEHLSNDQKDHPSPHKNSHKLYDKRGIPFLSLKESQKKLRQQYDKKISQSRES